MWLTNGELPQPPGSSHDYMVPWQAFATQDGYIVWRRAKRIFWRNLCEVIGEPRSAAIRVCDQRHCG